MAVKLPSHFTLNNGLKIPSVGLGTWQSKPGEVRDAVAHALKSGYTHIDCAWAYRNEKEVGEGIKLSGVDRKNIWVTSKLFEFHHSHVRQACQDTLQALGLDYLDMYLVHWPVALSADVPADGSLPQGALKDAKTGKPQTDLENSNSHIATWREMEKLVDDGLVKSIGVSNFNIRRLRTLLKEARIKPVADQIELSLACSQPELVSWLQKNDILPQAYSPLGSTGAKHASLSEIEAIAKTHDCSGANVIISWLVARGCNPLPKSVTPSRIEGNQKLIQLSESEFNHLNKLAADQKITRVCDQTGDFEPLYDIFEANHPENNDVAQAKLG